MESNKSLSYSIGGKRINLAIADLLSGATFLAMGILTFYLAFTDRLFMQAGGYQTNINIYLTKISQSIRGVTQAIPEFVWALLLVIIIGGIIWRVARHLNKEK